MAINNVIGMAKSTALNTRTSFLPFSGKRAFQSMFPQAELFYLPSHGFFVLTHDFAGHKQKLMGKMELTTYWLALEKKKQRLRRAWKIAHKVSSQAIGQDLLMWLELFLYFSFVEKPLFRLPKSCFIKKIIAVF